jgi:protein-L-isoaspartate(D-aspartate) O-methyltransferase
LRQRLELQRLHMVNGQLRTADVTDLSVLAAFLEVPRERFVAPARTNLAYFDSDPPAAGAERRRLLAPRTLALLLQAAAIAPGESALDVGGGSGYSAALLDHIGASVVALESDRGAASFAREALAGCAGVEIVEGDLAAGAKGRGPFDVIVVEGAFEVSPDALLAELAENGRLVGVDCRAGTPEATLIERRAAGFGRRALFETRATALEAFKRAPSFAF